jgi:hypothetical protein
MSQASELMERLNRQKEEVPALQLLWKTMIPEFPVPSERQLLIWLRADFDLVVKGIEVTAAFYNKCLADLTKVKAEGRQLTKEETAAKVMSKARLESYVSGVIKNTALDAANKENTCKMCLSGTHAACNGESCLCIRCALRKQRGN